MIDRLRDWMAGGSEREYRKLAPLVLINGLAEQAASWFCNRTYWSRHFDVKVPEFLVYDGPMIQRRIQEGLPISVEYLTDQLERYLDHFVQAPPYHLVASSLGCQVAVEYAVRHPENINRLVLLCPSGVGGEEKLPVVEGVRHNDFEALIGSIFHSPRFANPSIVRHYERQFANKPWRKGILRTVRGTFEHCVRDKLPLITRPTLLLCGEQDRIVDPGQARSAVRDLPNYKLMMIRNCGHAPQIERASLVNRLVLQFLSEPEPVASVEQPAELLKPSYA